MGLPPVKSAFRWIVAVSEDQYDSSDPESEIKVEINAICNNNHGKFQGQSES